MQTADDEGVRLRAAKEVLDSLRGFHSESSTVETTTCTRVERTRRVVGDLSCCWQVVPMRGMLYHDRLAYELIAI